MATKGTMVMEAPSHSPRGAFRIRAVGRTDVGRQRKHNEDHHVLHPQMNLFVVADGMGGHNAGDVASRLSTTSLGNFYEATLAGGSFDKNHADNTDDMAADARRLGAGIRKANQDVWEISSTYQQHQGMGSTIVAVSFSPVESQLHVAHVGDSRVYQIRDGELRQLTRDHSLVNDALAMKPDLKPEELARLPKNIITRALGMKEAVKVDVQTVDVDEGDIYLMCSDGLTGMVTDDELLEVVTISDSLDEACETLINMANEAGGTDNITCVLLRVESADGSKPVARKADVASDDPTEDPAEQPRKKQNITVPPPSQPPPAGDGPEITADEAPLGAPLPSDVASLLAGGGEVEMDEIVEGEGEDVERCVTCDAELYLGDAFCTECGTPIEGEDG